MACLTDLPPAYCKIIIGRSREFFWQRREIQSVNLVNNNGEESYVKKMIHVASDGPILVS